MNLAINGNSNSGPSIVIINNPEQQHIDERMRAEIAIIRGDANVFLDSMLQGEDHLMHTFLQRKPEIVIKAGSSFDPATNIEFSNLSAIQYAYWVGDQERCDLMMDNAKQKMSPSAYQEFAAEVELQISALKNSDFCEEHGRSFLSTVMLEMREQIQLAKNLNPEALQQFTELRQAAQERVLPEFCNNKLKSIPNNASVGELISVLKDNHDQLEKTHKEVLKYRSEFAEKHQLPSSENKAELR